MSGTPDENLFTVQYNYWIETLNSILFRRIARLLLLLQTLLACLLMTGTGPVPLWGGVLMLLTFIQCTYRPQGVAANAALQADRYLSLIHLYPSVPPDELLERLRFIEHNDSVYPQHLRNPAYNCACLAMGIPQDPLKHPSERLLCWLTGATLT
ncbi:hypothetical protein NUM31_000241 [Salmonella enterica]|nr:hypothetical protein [Salmonella enterica]